MRNTFLLLALGILLSGCAQYDGGPMAAGNASMNGTPQAGNAAFIITSPSFADGTSIPAIFTCEGAGYNPELKVSGEPAGTKSLALTVYDTDAKFVHWVAFDMPPETSDVAQNVSGLGVQAANGLGKQGYIGPCPPPGDAHHYHFTVYALDATLGLPASTNMTALQDAMAGHVLAQAELVGLYKCSVDTPAADGLCR
jgi:Raf kinase inhibitor-like YbhB/YbcL family protein